MDGISNETYQRWAAYIKDISAIDVQENKYYLIANRLTPLALENGCVDIDVLLKKVIDTGEPNLITKIINAMTTNETLWFRDRHPFDTLSEYILPEYAEQVKAGNKDKVRIWCAASSTGQEPYSIAIILREFMSQNTAVNKTHFDLKATDISTTALFMAQRARYDGISMSRGMPQDLKQKYFIEAAGAWQLNEDTAEMVTYSKINLKDSFAHMGHQDIIFCRNVLIYFDDSTKRDILNRFSQLLKPDGILFLGASEAMLNLSEEFRINKNCNTIYYSCRNGETI